MKRCCRCETKKDLSEFWKQSSTRDGLAPFCKTCGRIRNKELREKTNDINGRKYYQRHKVEINKRTKEYKDTHVEETRELNKKNKKARIEREPDVQRVWRLKHRYGITLEEWNQMFVSQEGCCAICGRHQDELPKTFAVDHNHETGQVRGLLCRECNLAIGYLKNSPELLRRAISYLEERKI